MITAHISIKIDGTEAFSTSVVGGWNYVIVKILAFLLGARKEAEIWYEEGEK